MGNTVESGDVLFEVHHNESESPVEILERLRGSLEVVPDPPKVPPLIQGIMTGEGELLPRSIPRP